MILLAYRKYAVLDMLGLMMVPAKDTKSPNAPRPLMECDDIIFESVRNSPVRARLYLESANGKTRGVCMKWNTYEDGKASLYAVD